MTDESAAGSHSQHDGLAGRIYNSDSEPVEIASLAELVDDAAREGDEVSRSILNEAGEELGRLAISVIKQLGLQAAPFRVACVGSVFKAGDLVLKPLREAVLSLAPRAEFGPPLFPRLSAQLNSLNRVEESEVRGRC